MTIPEKMKCVWCNGTMYCNGPVKLGSGINSFTMFCSDCGAVAHFAKNSDREIGGVVVHYMYKEELEETEK